MGYESRFIIVSKSSRLPGQSEDLKVWAQRIADFNVSKCYPLSNQIRAKYKPTDCYFYADDDNTQVDEDKYGDPLLEVPIPDLIDMLEKEIQVSTYRRLRPLLQLLKGFDLAEWDNLVALHYGY